MGLQDDLKSEVADIFATALTKRDGNIVPESENLRLSNDGVELDGTVLYADLAASTSMVDNYKPDFAAKVYKSFLHCAARLIRNEGGVITAYDGDRIMAVFIGDSKNTSAAQAALRINWAKDFVINPAIKRQYTKTSFEMTHVTGVDTSKLLIVRTGVRGANDLVWVGRAANHAAKLTSLSASYPSYITTDVYNRLNKSCKFASDGRSMWEQLTWSDTGQIIYRSTWRWSP